MTKPASVTSASGPLTNQLQRSVMAAENLTAQRLRELLNYDPETGVFTRRLKNANCVKIGDIAGSLDGRGYCRIRIDGKKRRAHRLAWLYMHGKWPLGEIDHINGFPADNRISNLRDVSHTENTRNVHKPNRDNASSKFRGVHWHRRDLKWTAQIRANGTIKYLGAFATEEAAAAAYVAAKKIHHDNGPTVPPFILTYSPAVVVHISPSTGEDGAVP